MLYKLAKKSEENWNPSMRMPTDIAIITITIMQFINAMTIYVILVHGFMILEPFPLSKELVVIFALMLYLLNYLFFIKKRRFLKIEKRFDKDSAKEKSIKKIFFWIYLILSFTLLIFVFNEFKTVDR